MKGPGKYDELCTLVQQATGADGVILMVLNGNLGSGFSVQATADIHRTLPEYLRQLAALLEAKPATAANPVVEHREPVTPGEETN